MSMKGAFVTLEGIDGSGKTTLCKLLAEKLSYRNAVITSEPTHEHIGKFIRDGSAGKISQRTESLLFLADRSNHTEQINALTANGSVVLCDRYFASTLAYQSAVLGGDRTDMEWLEKISEPFVHEADITFLLDIDPKISLGRVGARGEDISKFENLDFLEEVRKTYLSLADKYNFIILDASKPVDELADVALKEIEKIL